MTRDHDLNLVVLSGRTTGPLRLVENGDGLRRVEGELEVRLVRPRRRVDSIPFVWPEPNLDVVAGAGAGASVWMTGWLRARKGREAPSRGVELVVHDVELRGPAAR